MLSKYQSIRIEEFDYPLPDERIAKFPLPQRDKSKLLVYKNDEILDKTFENISDVLPENSLLLLNDTKVIQARLHFQKDTGANIEVFCLEPIDYNGDYSLALAKKGNCKWKCIAGNLKKWKGTIFLPFENNDVKGMLYANIESKIEDAIIVNFNWQPENLDFATVLENAGKIPLPPYIKRETVDNDKYTYQTVYAQYDGSVAAPTAGLHFTPEVFKQIKKRGIDVDYITLHVGAGTFKPVSADIIGEHTMHQEHVFIKKELIEKIQSHINRPVIAVGTTTVRSIESLIQIARKIKVGNTSEIFTISQWEPYIGENQDLPKTEALQIILDYMDTHKIKYIEAFTGIMIVPGYKPRIIDGLITNFHQPKSTLLLLVSAFIGDKWKSIYKHALENNYRFLSYGDSSFFIKS